MALANYTDLQASIASWLHNTALTANIPDFIALAEARIARDLRLRKQITTTTLTTTAGVEYVTLPDSFVEAESVDILANSIRKTMRNRSIEQMDLRYPVGLYTAVPEEYAILGQTMRIGPVPDSAYTITVTHYTRFDPLSTTATNWLLTNFPGVYLFGALAEAAPFMIEDARTQVWEAKYQAEAQNIQKVDDDAVRSGSSLTVTVN